MSSDKQLAETINFSWSNSCQLLICSDGLLEAESPEKEAFGEDRLNDALRDTPPVERKDVIRTCISRHLDGATAHDDISLLLLNCPAI